MLLFIDVGMSYILGIVEMYFSSHDVSSGLSFYSYLLSLPSHVDVLDSQSVPHSIP